PALKTDHNHHENNNNINNNSHHLSFTRPDSGLSNRRSFLSSALSPAPTNISELDMAISSFAEMDLQSGDAAFNEWLLRKKKQQKRAHKRETGGIDHLHQSRSSSTGAGVWSLRLSSNETSNKGPLNKPKDDIHVNIGTKSEKIGGKPRVIPLGGGQKVAETDLNNLPREELQALVRRRRQNGAVFKAWLERKEEANLAEKERERALQARLEAQKRDEELKMAEKRRRVREAVMRWVEEKKEEEARAEMERRVKAEREEEEKKKRREIGEKAFLEWKKGLAVRPVELKVTAQDIYPHQQRWIDLAPTVMLGGKTGNGRRRNGKDTAEFLSPPHLYREYERYETMAPDFVRKYPYQVASAGRKPNLESGKPAGVTSGSTAAKSTPTTKTGGKVEKKNVGGMVGKGSKPTSKNATSWSTQSTRHSASKAPTKLNAAA
ncbi:hypothetical protein HDU76_006229, partial [Blyttiomyces sp. JEL0837]